MNEDRWLCGYMPNATPQVHVKSIHTYIYIDLFMPLIDFSEFSDEKYTLILLPLFSLVFVSNFVLVTLIHVIFYDYDLTPCPIILLLLVCLPP